MHCDEVQQSQGNLQVPKLPLKRRRKLNRSEKHPLKKKSKNHQKKTAAKVRYRTDLKYRTKRILQETQNYRKRKLVALTCTCYSDNKVYREATKHRIITRYRTCLNFKEKQKQTIVRRYAADLDFR